MIEALTFSFFVFGICGGDVCFWKSPCLRLWHYLGRYVGRQAHSLIIETFMGYVYCLISCLIANEEKNVSNLNSLHCRMNIIAFFSLPSCVVEFKVSSLAFMPYVKTTLFSLKHYTTFLFILQSTRVVCIFFSISSWPKVGI